MDLMMSNEQIRQRKAYGIIRKWVRGFKARKAQKLRELKACMLV
jgi:hypothetical protein